jgi:hypothetical protein
MAAGLQIWDASGRLVVDFTSRLSRIIDSVYLNGSAASGSVTNAALSQGTPFLAFQQESVWGYIDGDVSRPNFTVSGNTISWTYTAAFGTHNQRIKGWLFYGVR